MNPSEYQEEWLSAYLDGELTEQQRLIVEARLATDTAARATLEDLKRVRKLVSELIPWTGVDLLAKMDSIVNRPFEDEVGDKSAVQRSFDEVPESLNSDESRSGAMAETAWHRNRSRRFPLTWLASAASILLAVGLGAAMWYGAGSVFPGLALRDSAKTSAPAGAVAATKAAESDPLLRQSAEKEFANGYLPDPGAVGSFAKTSENSPLASLQELGGQAGSEGASVMQKSQSIEGDLNIEGDSPVLDSPLVDSLAANLPSQADVQTAVPGQPTAPGRAARSALSETALGRSAMGGFVPAAPALASPLSAPAPASNALALAPPEAAAPDMSPAENSAEAAFGAVLEDFAAKNGKPAAVPETQEATAENQKPVVRIARSSVWSDAEIEAALAGTLNSLGLQTKIAGSTLAESYSLPLIEQQSAAEVASPAVILAAIDSSKIENADIFVEIVGENQLATLELATALEGRTLGRGLAEQGDGTKLAESLVLFLTQADAERVLEKLRQSGAVKPQVWQVAMAPQAAASVAPSSAASSGAVDPLRTLGTATATDKVILLLSTPPR